jgi:H+/gluconate symporter-like permease
MTPTDWKLIALALAAIAALVLLVTRWKVNAFIALVRSSWAPAR